MISFSCRLLSTDRRLSLSPVYRSSMCTDSNLYTKTVDNWFSISNNQNETNIQTSSKTTALAIHCCLRYENLEKDRPCYFYCDINSNVHLIVIFIKWLSFLFRSP